MMSMTVSTKPKSKDEYTRIRETLAAKNFTKTLHGEVSSIFRKENITIQVIFPPKGK